jgi:hypothetical protein
MPSFVIAPVQTVRSNQTRRIKFAPPGPPFRNRERCGYVVFNRKETSQIPSISEPWFLAFNARLTFAPAMNPQDLANAAPGIEQAVKTYGQTSNA